MNKTNQNNNILDNKIYNNIIENDCISDGDKLLVAVSGGSDSMALIHFLYTNINKFKDINNINYEIAVVHVNHMLRDKAIEETNYVERYCLSKSIKFFKTYIDINKVCKEKGIGTEECARNLRYEFFNKICNEEGYNKIVLAHNKNDNVETILLNILRGSGIKGLCGMEYKFKNLIRPLLEISKDDINKYCSQNNVKYYIDQSNLENVYTRNKVRNELLPYIKKDFNINFDESILRLSKLAKLDEEFLNEYVNEIYNNLLIDKQDKYIIINYKILLSKHLSIKNRMMRKIINELINNLDGIESVHIKDIIRLLENNITSKKFILGNKFKVVILKKYTAKFERII